MQQEFRDLFPSLQGEHSLIEVTDRQNDNVMVSLKVYEQQVVVDHCYDKGILQGHLELWMNLARKKDPSLIRFMFEVFQECEWAEDESNGP